MTQETLAVFIMYIRDVNDALICSTNIDTAGVERYNIPASLAYSSRMNVAVVISVCMPLKQ